MNAFRIFNTIAFVVFCLAIGEAAAILLTGLIYESTPTQIFEFLTDPVSTNRTVIVIHSFFSTVFRLLVFPVLYLLLTDKNSIKILWNNMSVRITPFILSILVIFAVMPLISILIEINYKVVLPDWLSGVEMYFRSSEEKAQRLTGVLLSFGGINDLIIAIFVVAIIPGVAEEIFFRGMVQTQLQHVFKSPHYAVFISAFLFSFFHFQFYSFIPKMILGVLLGYIFVWSKNIWYSSVAHVTNNLIVVVGAYFFGFQIDFENRSFIFILLLIASVVASALIILYLKKFFNHPRTATTRIDKNI